MNVSSTRHALMAGVTFAYLLSPLSASAQNTPNEIVVTPLRTEATIGRTGNAITIVPRSEIENWGSQSVADALRSVPGVSITQNGGPAGLATLRLRGSEARHSMIMIDGIRVGDPSSTGGEFDLSLVNANDIERIEVLRGPQSALYGSEAIGGVVNIITRKGKGNPKASLSLEGGSYGMRGGQASLTGATKVMTYAFAASGFANDGFSAFGHNIRRLERERTTPFETDLAQKASASARVGFDAGEGVTVEAGALHTLNANHYDSSFGDDLFSRQRNTLSQGWVRGGLDSFDNLLHSTLKLYGNHTDRRTGSVSFGPPKATDFEGDRFGVDLQNDLKIGSFGTLTFGLVSEHERGTSRNEPLPRGSGTAQKDFDGSQTTNSAYLVHQWPINERLTLSLSGRVDAVQNADAFPTARASIAYLIPETGTKLRASLGTGAKIPSIYQRFSSYGTAGLQAEKSVGADAGVDQTLFSDRLTLSGTVFYNRIRELIDFQSAQYDLSSFESLGAPGGCKATQVDGCYFNVARAETKGAEFGANLLLIPSMLRMKLAYTFLLAEDLATHTALLRRPQHQAAVSLVYTGIDKVEIEPRVTFVGHRMDYDSLANGNVRLAPYAKLDVLASYKFSDTYSAYIRGENLTNAHYEDVRNFGIAGRAAYAGIKAVW